MAFYGHRCRRPECLHPDYFSAASRERGSATRGQTVDGTNVIEWSLNQGGASKLRGSCGDTRCKACLKGCDYGPSVEFTQYTGEFGVESERLVPPGEGTTGATVPAPIYACACDACRDAWAAAQ
jgi:hypothetical protein